MGGTERKIQVLLGLLSTPSLCSCLQSLPLKTLPSPSDFFISANQTRRALSFPFLNSIYQRWLGFQTNHASSLLFAVLRSACISIFLSRLKHFLLLQFNCSLLGATDIKSHPTALYPNLWVTDLSSPRESKSLEGKNFFFFFLSLQSLYKGPCMPNNS